MIPNRQNDPCDTLPSHCVQPHAEQNSNQIPDSGSQCIICRVCIRMVLHAFFPRLEREKKNGANYSSTSSRSLCAMAYSPRVRSNPSCRIRSDLFQLWMNCSDTVVVPKETKSIAFKASDPEPVLPQSDHTPGTRSLESNHGHFMSFSRRDIDARDGKLYWTILDPDHYFARGSDPVLPSKSICSPCSFAISSSVALAGIACDWSRLAVPKLES